MNTDDLDTKSEQELDAIFAEEVAGWTKVRPMIRIRTHDRINILKGNHPEAGDRLTVPHYSASADAVLPWLYREHWVVSQTSKAEAPLRVRIGDEHGPFGEAATFPRAACIALIRAQRAKNR